VLIDVTTVSSLKREARAEAKMKGNNLVDHSWMKEKRCIILAKEKKPNKMATQD